MKALQIIKQELIDKFKFRNFLFIICIPKATIKEIINKSCTAINMHLHNIETSNVTMYTSVIYLFIHIF